MGYQVALVVVDPGWTPRSWDDFPESGRVEQLTTAKSRAHAEGIIYAHNSPRVVARKARGATGSRWAVLLHPRASVTLGRPCHRRVAFYDAG